MAQVLVYPTQHSHQPQSAHLKTSNAAPLTRCPSSMNSKLLTPAEKAANKVRRANRKALKRKRKRDEVRQASLEQNPLNILIVAMEDEEMLLLQIGTPAQKRRVLEKLAVLREYDSLMPEEQWEIFVAQHEKLISCPRATHELIRGNGKRWRIKRQEPFTLW